MGEKAEPINYSIGHLEKLAFCDFFSRLRRVVTRWIIANYNISFSKLPLKRRFLAVPDRLDLRDFMRLPCRVCTEINF